MKFSFPVFRDFCAIFVLFLCLDASSQQLADEIQSKLSEPDQKIIVKADDTYTKGDLLLYKANYPGDELIIGSSEPNSKLNKKNISKRLEAAGFYKKANEEKYSIYTKNIKDFWKNFKEEQNKLVHVKKVETLAFEQFQKAQQFRSDAGKNSGLESLSLIFKAEENEKNALVKLQQVLITYLSYPTPYNASWFHEEPLSKGENIGKAVVSAPQPAMQPPTETIKPQVNIPAVVPTEATSKTGKNIISPPQPVVQSPKDTMKAQGKKPEILSKDVVKGNEEAGEPSLYSIVDVNENQIDAFNKFMQKQYPEDYEKYIIDFSTIDYSDLQSLRNTWYKYRFRSMEDSTAYYANLEKGGSPSDTAQQIIAQDLLASNPANDAKDIPLDRDKKTGKGVAKHENTLVAASTSKTTSEKGKTAAKTNANPASGTFTNVTSEPVAHGFLFKVQIAACRIALDNNVVSGIYNGNETINQTYENDWYKYTIGEFNTYRDAKQMRDGLNVPGAFVVAYLNGKRIKITPTVAKKQNTETPLPENIQPQFIQFRLQVAASKNELSEEILKNIYNGTNQIIMVLEEDWYRYSILAGNKLADALELLKTINIPGAFIVTYYNNQRINLRSAIQLTKFN